MYLRRRIRVKRYIVDGNVTDTRHVVGFASERLFVDYTDHAALLRAVADEVKGLHHHPLCNAVYYNDGQKCTCPRGKVLAMLEVE